MPRKSRREQKIPKPLAPDVTHTGYKVPLEKDEDEVLADFLKVAEPDRRESEDESDDE